MPKKNEGCILIVEDERSLSDAYKMVLTKAGYTVRTAFDGQDALEVIKEEEPVLILLDLRMPRMDGIEFLRHFNLKEKHPKVKVIVFSNYDMQKEIDEAYRLGAERYILKAWASPKELLQVVQNTLAND
ncbi:MAG TPA: response regulator [Candidatus Saccharimonadales bacterium]|nr:response regulator [Candidatus Saccharimonadales bacterium]